MWLTSMLSNFGELSLKYVSYRLVAADLRHHLFLVQPVGEERLELVQADVHRVEVLVRVGRPVQAAHPAELVGTFLEFFLRHPNALLLRRLHREPVPDELLDEPLELPVQLRSVCRNSVTLIASSSIFTSVVMSVAPSCFIAHPPIWRKGSSARSIRRRSRTTTSAVAVMP